MTSKTRDLLWGKSFLYDDAHLLAHRDTIHDAQAQVVLSGNDDTRCVAGNGRIILQPVACGVFDPKTINRRSVNLREIGETYSPNNLLEAADPYLLHRLFYVVNKC